MEEGVDLKAPVLYQSCVAGGAITTGAVFYPLVAAAQSLAQVVSPEDKSSMHHRMWMLMNSIDGRVAQDLAANYVAQHMWQCAWKAGNGASLTVDDLRRALDSPNLHDLLSHGLPDDPRGENTEVILKRILVILDLFEEIPGAREELFISSPEQWSAFKGSCVNAAVGRPGAFSINAVNHVIHAARGAENDLESNTYCELLSALGHAIGEYSFAPRRYISGEEILEWIAMVEEYNEEWANAAMEWMRGEL